MKLSRAYGRQVFLNCPFDADYRPVFDALVFTILATGFVIRCAKGLEDSGETRFDKIVRIIKES